MTGHWEWLLILLAILIIFGAGKLPSVLKSMGEGINEFKKASRGEGDDAGEEEEKEEAEEE